VRSGAIAALFLTAAALGRGAADDLSTAAGKIDAIVNDRLRAGTRVVLSSREMNAWVRSQAPAGVREPTVRIDSPGVATISAMIDIGKVARTHGFQPVWPLSKLLDGEHPVRVTALIRSARGNAEVDVKRAEISGLEIDGWTLDLLVRYLILPSCPNVVVGRPFGMAHNIQQVDVEPAAVAVVIGPGR
jgi:hypothetical protein